MSRFTPEQQEDIFKYIHDRLERYADLFDGLEKEDLYSWNDSEKLAELHNLYRELFPFTGIIFPNHILIKKIIFARETFIEHFRELYDEERNKIPHHTPDAEKWAYKEEARERILVDRLFEKILDYTGD